MIGLSGGVTNSPQSESPLSESVSENSSSSMNWTALELCPSGEVVLGMDLPPPGFLPLLELLLDGSFGSFELLDLFFFSQAFVSCEPSVLQKSHLSLSLGILQSFLRCPLHPQALQLTFPFPGWTESPWFLLFGVM